MKSRKRSLLALFGIFRLYLMRGHAMYFALPITMLNASLIIYNFLVKNLSWLPDKYKSYPLFLCAFIIILVPLAVVVGRLDYRSKIFKAETNRLSLHSPVWQRTWNKLDKIIEQIEKQDK